MAKVSPKKMQNACEWDNIHNVAISPSIEHTLCFWMFFIQNQYFLLYSPFLKKKYKTSQHFGIWTFSSSVDHLFEYKMKQMFLDSKMLQMFDENMGQMCDENMGSIATKSSYLTGFFPLRNPAVRSGQSLATPHPKIWASWCYGGRASLKKKYTYCTSPV